MKKTIVICIDGWDSEYLDYRKMNFIESNKSNSFTKIVDSMMPSVTNVNNISILTGQYPSKHGICSNYNYSIETNHGVYLEENKYIQSKTIFDIYSKNDLTTLLATSKNKLKTLIVNNLNKNTSFSAEKPSKEDIIDFGIPPSIYSIKANSWTIKSAAKKIKEINPEFAYITLTDYAMHKFHPESEESMEHLKLIDEEICNLIEQNMEYEIFITADHGMSEKSNLINLEEKLNKFRIKSKAVPIIKDKHEIHHSNLGGSIYVYLYNSKDVNESKKIIQNLKGVDEVLTKSEAFENLNLKKEMIGDLIVMGDKNTVFGDIPKSKFPRHLRSHASKHETSIPLVAINSHQISDYFIENKSIGSYIINSYKTLVE